MRLAAALLFSGLVFAAPVDDLMANGHYKRAREAVQAMLAKNPNDAQAHALSAKIKIAFRDYDGGVAEAEQSVKLDPKSAFTHFAWASTCAEAAGPASYLKALSMVKCLKREVDAALAIDPGHIQTLLVQMLFYFKAPSLVGGDKNKAQQIADKVAGLSPVWGALAHARLAEELGNDPEKELHMKKAVALGPEMYSTRTKMGLFYCCDAKAKHPDLAEKVAKEAIAIDPTNVGGYQVLAKVYSIASRWSELDDILVKGEQAVADDFVPYYAAAETLLEQNREYVRAEKYLSKYLSIPPEGEQPTAAVAKQKLAIAQKNAQKITAR